MRLFGQNLYGLMMGSVIAGTLVIPAVFLLGREMFGRRVGLVAAVLSAISYSDIHFSRVVLTETASAIYCLTVRSSSSGACAHSKGDGSSLPGLRGWGLLAYSLAGSAL